jgi:D-tyrosyl-tRNA(Tyr) deacylase
VLLVGFKQADQMPAVEWMAEKVVGLRMFADDAGKMNRSIDQIGGSILVVSQFTLYGDASKGRRPSFIEAARPDVAVPLYDAFVRELRGHGIPIATGEFGAMMEVELVNDGPVTVWLER